MVKLGVMADSMKPMRNLSTMKPAQEWQAAYKVVRIDHSKDATQRSFPGGTLWTSQVVTTYPHNCYMLVSFSGSDILGGDTYAERQYAAQPAIFLSMHVVVCLKTIQRSRADLNFVHSSKRGGKQKLLRVNVSNNLSLHIFITWDRDLTNGIIHESIFLRSFFSRFGVKGPYCPALAFARYSAASSRLLSSGVLFAAYSTSP